MIRQNPLHRTMIFMLTWNGILPGASCVLFWRMLLISSSLFAQYVQYRYIIINMHTATLWDLMEWLTNILADFKVIFKLIMLWCNQRKLIEILTVMREDWNDCADNDISMRETASKAKTSKYITHMIIVFHIIAVLVFSIAIVLANVDVTNNATEILFIQKMELPFDINTQRTYRLILLTEFFYILMCALSACITNSLLLILIVHAAGQINIVCYWLTQIVSCKDENRSELIAKIIQKHNKIIYFSKNIESLYTYSMLIIFVTNSIQICAQTFLVITAVDGPNAVKYLVRFFFFFAITNFEAFIFCYAGEYLTNKSKEIGFATYSSLWYDMKPKDSRILILLILRSQKQLTLTVGKIMDLSLQTFTSNINASVSFLSLLLAMR